MMALSESDEGVLYDLAKSAKFASVPVDELFSVRNVNHRRVLAAFCERPDVLTNLVGMDDGKYDSALALNEKAPADALASLAMSDNVDVRKRVALNKNIPLPTIELLLQDDEMKQSIATNPSTPLNILEALATDEDDGVRMAVMANSAAPERLLKQMLADPANSNINVNFGELYGNQNFSLFSLADAMDEQFERDGELSDDLREAVYMHDRFMDSLDALPRGTAVSLSKCEDTGLREYSARFPNLPVRDILRLVEDPEVHVFSDLEDNSLVQVAVDKLSRLLSNDMMGSDSHFDNGEQWW